MQEKYMCLRVRNFSETVACNRLNVHAHLNLQINREHREMDISAHSRHPVSSNWMFARRAVTERRRAIAYTPLRGG